MSECVVTRISLAGSVGSTITSAPLEMAILLTASVSGSVRSSIGPSANFCVEMMLIHEVKSIVLKNSEMVLIISYVLGC